MNGPVFHVVTAVWGRAYIDLFLTTAIPNQLSAGNLEVLPQGSRYRIFTSAEDRAQLQSAAAVRALQAVLPVDIVVMDPDGDEAAKYKRMIRYHRRAVEDALHRGAALIFLAPDHVLSSGTMGRLVDLRAAGYRAVLCTGLRLSKEPMLQALARHGARDLPPRALVRMALEHLHPSTGEFMIDAALFARHPASVYWRVNGNGLLARCFSLHPLMLHPVRQVLPKKEIDAQYPWRSVPDLAMVHVVTDSDDLVVFEMTSRDDALAQGHRSWSKVWRTAGVAARCDSHQLAYWCRSIRLHSTDLDDAWASVEVDAARFAQRVLRRMPHVRRVLPLADTLSGWHQRWDRRARNWRRRLPRIRMKQIKRPVRLAISQSRKRVRHALRR